MRLPLLIGATALAAAAWLDRRPAYSFRGKHVLITGGARGLGLLLARRLADEGATLYLISRTERQLAQAAAELRARGADVYWWVCDVREPDAVRDSVERVVRQAGRIDVLINNAGVIEATPWEHATLADYRESLQVHFWAPLFAIRSVVPHMRRQRSGRILNVSSIGGRVAVPHLNPYCVGKHALLALSDGVRAELAKDGIVVTTATPGLMRTGSHVNVAVRGQHRREAMLFGLMTATPLTSMDGDRAAGRILDALRSGRAQVTTGWQAQTLAGMNAMAPETTAWAVQAATRLLPGPTAPHAGSPKQQARDIDLGVVEAVLPASAAARNNEL